MNARYILSRLSPGTRLSIWILGSFILIGILSPILATDKPLYAHYKGYNLFPALFPRYHAEIYENLQKDELGSTDWKRIPYDFAVWPPVTYSPGQSDYLNAQYSSPFSIQKFRDADGNVVDIPWRYRHWLGTNKRGEDVLSGIIHGIRLSLEVGFGSIAIAGFMGILLGSWAGFFGDNKLVMKTMQALVMALGIFAAFFYVFELSPVYTSLEDGLAAILIKGLIIFAGIIMIFRMAGKWVARLPVRQRNLKIPVDFFITRLTEILVATPKLILILSISAISRPSVALVIWVIGLTSWSQVARLTRAEFLRIRELDYIAAGKSMGLSSAALIFRHILPNSFPPVMVALAFGVASAILAESSLSFLGVGIPPELVTLGSIISSGKENFSAWWLILFPGLVIFFLIAGLNRIGDALNERYRTSEWSKL